MNLRSLTDDLLLKSTLQLAQKERKTTLEVLHHLLEIERRSLFAVLSYSSLFEYTLKELKYSEGAAQRRISSMRLLKEVPEMEKKIESGDLSLSALSQAQTFFRQEKCGIEQKREILISLEKKSRREVERKLLSLSSEPLKLLPDKLRAVSETHSELKILVEAELLEQIEELRGLVATRAPGATVKDLISYAIGHTLKELRPKAPKKPEAVLVPPPSAVPKLSAQKLQPLAMIKSRYIPVEVKREIWERDGGQCSFKDALSGRRCTSTHGLEYDHIRPFAFGGEPSVDNLRLCCRAHNQLAAVEAFGQQKMSQFVSRMK